MTNYLGRFLGIYAAILFAPALFSPVGAATWLGGPGDWETAENWDTLVVPDGATEDVVITAAADAQLNSARTIRNLTISSAQDQLAINPGASLQLEGTTLNNQGVIALESNAGQSSTLTITNPMTSTSSGTIQFGDENSVTSLSLDSRFTLAASTQLKIAGESPGLGRGGTDGLGELELADHALLTFDSLNFFSVDNSIDNKGIIEVVGQESGQVNFNSLTVDQFGAPAGAGELIVSGNNTLQLSNVTVHQGDVKAEEDGLVRILDGSYEDINFSGNVRFQSGVIDMVGVNLFLGDNESTSVLGSAANMRLNGQSQLGGHLTTEPGARISAISNGSLLPLELTLSGAGSVEVSAPVDITNLLTIDHEGEVNFTSSEFSLGAMAEFRVENGTARLNGVSITQDDFRDQAIAVEGTGHLRLVNSTLESFGITLGSSSTVDVQSGTLEEMKFSGGTTNVQGTVYVLDSLEWDSRITLSEGAKLTASMGDVEWFGSGEIEFLDNLASEIRPEIVASAVQDHFVIPSGETVTMSGEKGRVGRLGETEPTLIVEGNLVIKTRDLEIRGNSTRLYGSGRVSEGATVIVEEILDMLSPQPEELLAASSDGNFGGTLLVEAGSQVALANGATIRGGTLESEGDGAVVVEYNTFSGGFATFVDTNNQGNVVVQGLADVGLKGSVTNSGSIKLGEGTTSTFQSTDVLLIGEVELDGDGVIETAGMAGVKFTVQSNGGNDPTTFVNGTTIMASRPLSFGTTIVNTPVLINRGTIVAEDDIEVYLPAGEELTNEGTIELTTADSRLFFRTAGSVIRNSGEIVLGDAGSRVTVDTFIQDGGMTKGLGTLRGNVTLNGGTMQFGGTLDGTLSLNAGVIEIGDPVGELTLTRDFNQSADTLLRIDIGGLTPETEFDVLNVQGFFGTLGGPLEVSLLDLGTGLFVPDDADTFQILQTLNSVTGAFSNVADGARLTTAEGLGSFVVNYGLNSSFGFNNVVLSDFQFDPSADFDDDGDVDAADLAMWQSAYGANSTGDTDSDNDSDGTDFLRWQLQHGISASSLEAASNVPEPSSAVLMLLSLLSLRNVGRRAR